MYSKSTNLPLCQCQKLRTFQPKNVPKALGGRASPRPAGGAYSAPPDLLAGFKREGGEKTGGDRQQREGTEEGGKGRKGRRDGTE